MSGSVYFTRDVDFSWKVYDGEELVGAITVEEGFGFMELVFLKELRKPGLS